MKCSSPDHSGLALAEYSGPTHTIEQFTLANALRPYNIIPFDGLRQTQHSNVPARLLDGFSDSQKPLHRQGSFSTTRAIMKFFTPDTLVSLNVESEIAQREPVDPRSDHLKRESFDVSGCGPRVTAACAFVAKGLPWEALVRGGTAQISTPYTGNNLPPMHQVDYDAGLSPTWQATRPFGQAVLMNAYATSSAPYNGQKGSEFRGEIHLTGSMLNLAETAVAQAATLSHILDDPAKAERTIAHIYGGSQEALHEAWSRALSPETQDPSEAARLAYDILAQ